MSDAQAESEELVNAVLPHAEGMLIAHGQFFPFGGAVTLDGDIAQLAVGEEHREDSMEDVVEALESGGSLSPSGEDGLRALELADAARRSMETGRVVRLGDGGGVM